MPSSVTGSEPLGESPDTTETASTPSVASSTSATSCSCSSVAMTTAGVPEPPGKWALSSAWPSRACDSPSTNSLDGTPSAFSCVIPSAMTASSRVETIHVTRGRRAMRRATFGHTPRRPTTSSASTCAPNFGRTGQNAARPAHSMSAGSRVSAVRTAKAMPMADTGPRILFEVSSLASSMSRPAITVPPEARIGSHEPRSAAHVASHLRSWVCRASRYRAM